MAERDHTPMTGFYSRDPRADEIDTPIELSEIMTALEATSLILSETIDSNDVCRNAGMANAIRTLVTLLRQRDTGEEVIKKPRREPPGPSKRKSKPRLAPVISIVRPGVMHASTEAM